MSLTSNEDARLVRGLEKRKACDLCHVKKIRCDAARPTCSHCVVYGAQCAYTPHIKKRRGEIKVQRSVKTAVEGKGELPKLGSPTRAIGLPGTNGGSAKTPASSVVGLGLPPLSDLLPWIQEYFTHVNAVIPLFEEASFVEMFESGATDSPRLQAATITAALNVILALTYHHHRPTTSTVLVNPETCVANAEEALSRLSDRHCDLLSLQVRLGLVMLHQVMPASHQRQSAASFLMASAVKMTHKLGLHDSRTNDLFDADDILQRNRVFWITYLLDRDIGMRWGEPPLHRDSDHDIQMPASSVRHGIACFRDSSGAEIELDIFRAQVHLAHIQGEIYDKLHSVQASRQPPDALGKSTQQIHDTLREWLGTIPAELQLSQVGALPPQPPLRPLIAMYFTYLSCFQHMHRVGSHDAEWITRLIDYSQNAITAAWTPSGRDVVAPPRLTPAASPFQGPSAAWAEVVVTARECTKLFRMVVLEDLAMIWTTSCTYLSAVLVLTAHALTAMDHGPEIDSNIDEDDQLITEGLQFLESAAAGVPQWRRLHAACSELTCRARIMRARFTLEKPGPKPASVAWLETEARRSAGVSARKLVEAFTAADEKPLASSLWRVSE